MGPPGDFGYWELRGGGSCHLPISSVLRSMVPSAKDNDEMDASGGNDGCEDMGNESHAAVGDRHGPTLILQLPSHLSFDIWWNARRRTPRSGVGGGDAAKDKGAQRRGWLVCGKRGTEGGEKGNGLGAGGGGGGWRGS